MTRKSVTSILEEEMAALRAENSRLRTRIVEMEDEMQAMKVYMVQEEVTIDGLLDLSLQEVDAAIHQARLNENTTQKSGKTLLLSAPKPMLLKQ